MPTQRPKKSDPLLVACALLPAASLIALYGFVVRARLALGVWPQPYCPDPKDLGFEFHHMGCWLLLEAAIVSPAALVLCLLIHQCSSLRDRPAGKPLLGYFVGYAVLWALFVADPGSFFEWYGD